MRTLLITTNDDDFAKTFFESFLSIRQKKFTKIIILPSIERNSFPTYLRPLVAIKLMGIIGTIKYIKYKVLNTYKDSFHFGSITNELKIVENYSQKDLISEVSSLNPDILISVGAPIIFSKELLSLPTIGAINLHNGNIKKYRGHFSTFWEAFNKESNFSISLHEMNEKVDSGMMLDHVSRNKNNFKDFFDVMLWKKQAGGKLLANTLNKFEINKTFYAISADKSNSNESKSSYYGFPSFKDIMKFSFWK
jgi:methionyl-tRNA formyltransferase